MSTPFAPAFPSVGPMQQGGPKSEWQKGMDLRTYAAVAALQGLLSGMDNPEGGSTGRSENIAKHAVQLADALLKELEPKKK